MAHEKNEDAAFFLCRNNVLILPQSKSTILLEEDGSIDLWGAFSQRRTILKIGEQRITPNGHGIHRLMLQAIGADSCTFKAE